MLTPESSTFRDRTNSRLSLFKYSLNLTIRNAKLYALSRIKSFIFLLITS